MITNTPIQTVYNDRLDKTRIGHIRKGELCNLVSRSVEIEAGIEFGVPVTFGTGENQCNVIAADTDPILGITTRDRSVDPNSPNITPQYESANIMDFGVVSVAVREAVTAGTQAFFAVATQDWGNTGAIEVGQYISTTSGPGIAEIRVRVGG